MRLIDADKLPKYTGYALSASEVAMAVENAPTVDAVPVVRCKDCKWWKTGYLWNGTERKVCVIEPCEPCRKQDEFCSSGERKGGNE